MGVGRTRRSTPRQRIRDVGCSWIPQVWPLRCAPACALAPTALLNGSAVAVRSQAHARVHVGAARGAVGFLLLNGTVRDIWFGCVGNTVGTRTVARLVRFTVYGHTVACEKLNMIYR